MKSLNIVFALTAIITHACESHGPVENIKFTISNYLEIIGKNIGCEMISLSDGLNSELESAVITDSRYSNAYDSLFISMFGINEMNCSSHTNYTQDYMYRNWTGCRTLLDSIAINHMSINDTLYFSAYSSFTDGIIYEFTIFGNNSKKYMKDWVNGIYIHDLYRFSPCVELSTLAVDLLGLNRQWNPDSLRAIDRKVRAELHDEGGNIKIHDAYPMRVTSARIIINGEDIGIDTVSYATWDSPDSFIKIMRKRLDERKHAPFIDIYKEVFERYWLTCDRAYDRINLDKSDFLQVWRMLDIQPRDTVYLSLFIPLDKDGGNRHTVLFQSGAQSIWATNPMPKSYSNNNRSDATVYENSHIWHESANSTIVPNKHCGEAWDTAYRKLYRLFRIVMPRCELAHPDIWDNGKTHPYKVMNAKVEITPDGYAIDTMSYTANLRIPTLIDK